MPISVVPNKVKIDSGLPVVVNSPSLTNQVEEVLEVLTRVVVHMEQVTGLNLEVGEK